MKKLGYIILGFFIGGVLTYYFCPRDMVEPPTKIIKPSGVISVSAAKELNDNWTKYRKAAVDSAAKKQGRNQDDRSSWWSLEDVENYLDYAKAQSDSLGYTMSGIRIYLGVYGANAGQSKKDLTTMFIVPTGKKSVSQASSINVSLRGGDDDIPAPPLNKGGGGDSGYP